MLVSRQGPCSKASSTAVLNPESRILPPNLPSHLDPPAEMSILTVLSFWLLFYWAADLVLCTFKLLLTTLLVMWVYAVRVDRANDMLKRENDKLRQLLKTKQVLCLSITILESVSSS
jgi:hypothetical protein